MNKTVSIWVAVGMWLLFTFDCHAEVRVSGHDLSVNLEDASLARVMEQIGWEAGIDIAIMNALDYRNAVISEAFTDMPLEQGLDRLLNGWNYGLSKDPASGAVRTVMIVSRRTSEAEAHPVDTNVQIISNKLERNDSDQDLEDMTGQEFADEKTYLTDEELLNDTPPEMRELILSMQEQNGVK
ncbi:MAG: hypothetical protein MRJ96_09350 [Nitrospirales bacterium]|nr:hypothetical protein [Nitrospira sp.]MDR4501639.1 hypothetical protein [Nitrospirales bacterium]